MNSNIKETTEALKELSREIISGYESSISEGNCLIVISWSTVHKVYEVSGNTYLEYLDELSIFGVKMKRSKELWYRNMRVYADG